MGLFDYINVKWKLPELVQLKGTLLTQDVVQNASYQTKDLESFMDNYTIHEDGTVTQAAYEKTTRINDSSSFLGGYLHGDNLQHIPLEGNHTFNFCEYFDLDDGGLDFYIEWKATVIDCKLHSIVLIEFKSDNNQVRLENMARWKQMEIERNKYYGTIQYKYFFKYTNIVVNSFAKCVIKISKFVIEMCNKLTCTMYKLLR